MTARVGQVAEVVEEAMAVVATGTERLAEKRPAVQAKAKGPLVSPQKSKQRAAEAAVVASVLFLPREVGVEVELA